MLLGARGSDKLISDVSYGRFIDLFFHCTRLKRSSSPKKKKTGLVIMKLWYNTIGDWQCWLGSGYTKKIKVLLWNAFILKSIRVFSLILTSFRWFLESYILLIMENSICCWEFIYVLWYAYAKLTSFTKSCERFVVSFLHGGRSRDTV